MNLNAVHRRKGRILSQFPFLVANIGESAVFSVDSAYRTSLVGNIVWYYSGMGTVIRLRGSIARNKLYIAGGGGAQHEL